MSPRPVRTDRRPSLVTWPDALRTAQASGYTHFRLRGVNRGDEMVDIENPWLPIRQTLADVSDEPGDFAQHSERVELPFIRTMILAGPSAGTIACVYACERRPSVWDRLRAPEV